MHPVVEVEEAKLTDMDIAGPGGAEEEEVARGEADG